MFEVRLPTFRYVIIAIVLLFFSVLFFYYRSRPAGALTTAETSSKSKTEVFYAMQDKSVLSSGSSTSTDIVVFVGESSPVIKSAHLEVEGVTKSVASQNITVDFIQKDLGSFPTSRARTFVINSTGSDSPFDILYYGNDQTGNDLTSYLAGIVTTPSPYTFSVKIDISGASVSLLRAKLYLTYQYAPPASGPTVPNSNTLVFTALQNRGMLTSGSSTSTDFTVFVGEPNPVIKSAYIEVEGVTKAVSSQSITIDIIRKDAGSFPTSRARTFVIDSSGRDTPFDILYYGNDQTGNDLTSYLAGIITSPTSYEFTIKIDISGATVSLLQARLVLTYQFTQSGGGLPATGNLISPTFDTYAVNGVNFNWIMWKGSQPAGTKIRLQLATSNCPNGETNSPTCSIGGWGSGSDFVGSDCTAATYFEQTSSAVSNEVKCPSAHNNKRYFRYKAILCSNTDCATSGSQNPEVQDVIVNWSP